MKIQPVASNERVEAIDMMRGFALLGILIINMLTFHSPLSYVNPYTYYTRPYDAEIYGFIDIFIQASFYPLFSMLFGYGLAMQFLKAEEKTQLFIPLAARRLLVLLGIGILHAFLLWYGDILITYAVIGFLLIGMLNLPSRLLAWLAVLIYAVPHALLLALMFIAVSANPNFYTGIQAVQSSIDAYANGTFVDIFGQRLSDWVYSNNPFNFIIQIATILPFMMAGAAAAKWRLIERAKQYRKVWIFLAVVPLLAGLLLKATPQLFDKNYAFVYLQDIFGGPLVAVGYAAMIALLAQNAALRKLLRPFGQVGRMSLTIYIMQSLIATLIFYSYGFGLYGQVDLLTGTLIALGIFAIQLLFAEAWLSKFNQGPLEKLWRRLTYRKSFENNSNSKP
ncbi:DUF418 domain-containing protein [Planomicrobium sp. CPCC 101110]|uniref:DUF418 domain-containing protein n=1 Tax=Planomicrobium sp. CPCC 101110 TaxID=2599619 RepID=UPI0011B75527|nr:DUF418 domain-containing protein [Planomicrobium sp. CPCC 101110]TWT27961.1 DUF418 domain-containing protein [Planomicrobium sp. CPCC 101110]